MIGPERSLYWRYSRALAPLRSESVHGKVDCCAYGSPWKRRLGWWSTAHDLAGPEGRCTGHQHQQWPHFALPLAGRLPAGLIDAAAERIDRWWGERYGPGTGREERLIEDDVPPIPYRFVEGKWTWCWQHIWAREEHINLQEGRALVRAAERTCQSPKRLGRQHLILTDSQVMLGVAQKGRSSVSRLNRYARRLAALSMAFRQSFFSRWVPTKINPSDTPSREFSEAQKRGTRLDPARNTHRN